MPAKSKAQRRFMGIVESIKKGKTPKSYSPEAAKAAKSMSKSDVRHFTKTKEKGLPQYTGDKMKGKGMKVSQNATKEGSPFSIFDLEKKIKKRQKALDEIV